MVDPTAAGGPAWRLAIRASLLTRAGGMLGVGDAVGVGVKPCQKPQPRLSAVEWVNGAAVHFVTRYGRNPMPQHVAQRPHLLLRPYPVNLCLSFRHDFPLPIELSQRKYFALAAGELSDALHVPGFVQ